MRTPSQPFPASFAWIQGLIYMTCRIASLWDVLKAEGRQAGSLRVITGKGNHSSGGEASLGRVVANHLAGKKMSHTVQGGAIEVHVRATASAGKWKT